MAAKNADSSSRVKMWAWYFSLLPGMPGGMTYDGFPAAAMYFASWRTGDTLRISSFGCSSATSDSHASQAPFVTVSSSGKRSATIRSNLRRIVADST